MSKGIAKLIKDCSEDFRGHAALYKLSTPISEDRYTEVGTEQVQHNYVIVSSADAFFTGPETYIFPADEKGNVVNWGELDGSRRGSYSHADVLRFAGYEVVND